MAIYKSSNFSPNLSEIDVSEEGNIFSAQVNTSGEPVKAYALTIMDEKGDNTVYEGEITGVNVKNKNILTITDTDSTICDNLTNGNNYQWGIRMYNVDKGSTAKPNTLVCEGNLVGSTKYVVWMNLPDHGEDGVNKEMADNVVYDRYIEISASNADELIIGAHEDADKEKPATGAITFNPKENSTFLGAVTDGTTMTTNDATLVENYIKGTEGVTLSTIQKIRADVNIDGKIDSADVEDIKGALTDPATYTMPYTYCTYAENDKIKAGDTIYYTENNPSGIALKITCPYDKIIALYSNVQITTDMKFTFDFKGLSKFPYVQRKKIEWVDKELGTLKDYIKIETEEAFDYDYYDGHSFSIYKCSSDHTVTSAFADPNTNINVSDYIIIYNNLDDALKAFNAKDNPDQNNSGVVPAFGARKIIGYSSDTGEIRVHDSFASAPINGMIYRIFERNVTTDSYDELFTSDLVYKVKAGSIYYASTAPAGTLYYSATAAKGSDYYEIKDEEAKLIVKVEGKTLPSTTSCILKDTYTIDGTSTAVQCSEATITNYVPNNEAKLYPTFVGKVDYYSDINLQTKVSTLTADKTDCIYQMDGVASIVLDNHTYFVKNESSDTFNKNTDTVNSCEKITNYANLEFVRKTTTKEEGSEEEKTTEETKQYQIAITDTTATPTNYLVLSSEQSGGKGIDAETGYTFVSSYYSTMKVGTKSYQILTVQGGVATTSDNFIANNVTSSGGTIQINDITYHVAFEDLECNLNDIKLENPFQAQVIGGTAITGDNFKIISNRWDTTGDNQVHRLFVQPNINIKSDLTNPDEIVFENGVRINIVKQYWTNTKGKKVDVSFNKLDDSQWLLEDSSKNECYQSGSTTTKTSITDGIIIPEGKTVPIIPQTDYKVYTDFSDSMPMNLFYARKEPEITIKCKNYYQSKYETFEFDSDYYIPSGSKYFPYKSGDISKDWVTGDTVILPTTFNYYEGEGETKTLVGTVTDSLRHIGTWDSNKWCKVKVTVEGVEGEYYTDSPETETWENLIPSSGWTIKSSFSTITINASEIQGATEDYIFAVYTSSIRENPTRYMPMPSELYTSGSYIGVYDYRDMWFKSELTYTDESGNYPQVKYYKYSLYDSDGTLIGESEDTYSIDLEWYFRGFETGTELKPNTYSIQITVVDEYGKEFTKEIKFYIYYATEESVVPVNLYYDCHEHALSIDAKDVLYVDTTDLGSYTSVTVNNFHRDEDNVIDYIEMGENRVLNYTNVNNEDATPIYIPAKCSLLSEFQITGDFLENIPDGGSSTILVLGHEFSETEMTTLLNSMMDTYNTKYNNNIKFGDLGHMPTFYSGGIYDTTILYYNNNIEWQSQNGTTYYICVNLIKSSGSIYTDVESYIKDIIGPTAITITDLINNDKTGENARNIIFNVFDSSTSEETRIKYCETLQYKLDYYKYLLDNKIDNKSIEKYTLKLNDINTYYLKTTIEHGVSKNTYVRNSDVGYLRMYRNTETVPLTCFVSDSGSKSDYFSIGDNFGEEYVTNRELKYMLQKGENFTVVTALTTLTDIKTNMYYVLTMQDATYKPGVYKYTAGEWILDIQKDYVVVTKRTDIEDDTLVETDFIEQDLIGTDGYLWKDEYTSGDNTESYIYVINTNATIETNKEAFDNTWFTIYLNIASFAEDEDNKVNCYLIKS